MTNNPVTNYHQWILKEMMQSKRHVASAVLSTMDLSNMVTFDADDVALKRSEMEKESIRRRVVESRQRWLETQLYAIQMLDPLSKCRIIHVYYDDPTPTELSSVYSAIREFYLRALRDLIENKFQPDNESSPHVCLEMFEDMLGLQNVKVSIHLHGNLLDHPDNQWAKDRVSRGVWGFEFESLVSERIRVKVY